MSTSQSTDVSVGQVNTGGVLSSMVKVPVVVDLLPQSSVAVKITVAAPVAPHKSLKPGLLLLQVTLLQASVAAAPPLLSNHVLKSSALPDPHSTVGLLACLVIVGGVVSETFIDCSQVANRVPPKNSEYVLIKSAPSPSPQTSVSPTSA